MRSWTACGVVGAMALAAAPGCSSRGLHTATPLGGHAASWRYDVVATGAADELRVEAWLPRGSLSELVVRHGAEAFVHEVQVEVGDAWHDVVRRGAAFHAPECASGCHVRYRFALGEAARALHDTDMAIAWGEVVEASPSVWLLHPALAPAGTRYRFDVHTPPGVSFATGIFTAEDGRPDTYEAYASNIAIAPYAAFGRMRVRRIEAVTGAKLEVAIAPGAYSASEDALTHWVQRSALTMAKFLGCFPLERVMVLVVPAPGKEVRHGETMGDGGASIVVEVGEQADEGALAEDWVLPHEMAHLAVPSVSKRHHWLEEGVAVYVQPIARARARELSAEQVWREFANGMPKGVPLHGDRGLDETPDWARTYWGGATFCLVADVEIRRATGNRLGFEDALRGVVASGGNVAQIWRFDRFLDTADAAVGLSVFRRMHEGMGRSPWVVDLPTVFRELGVVVHDGDVTLDDAAPLAALRRAITEPIDLEARGLSACHTGLVGRLAQR